MKERPILFSAPMVRALLAGTKTQTRRALREGTWLDPEHGVIRMCSVGLGVTGFQTVACPYGKPGDRLWVRETWAPHFMYSDVRPAEILIDARSCLFYRADGGITGGCEQSQRAAKWRPAIHMPRAASRIALEVTEVRVERLQDISEADARAEGIGAYENGTFGLDNPTACMGPTAVIAYRRLWEVINGPGSWDANPWVWCVSFQVAKP